ncbi:MAG: hypothetical protein QGI24_06330 [Kiritimatiellia bacterium]|nr:hypothetical protein [Kiritimatiellia bacterium]MDP6848387.1 hypothetical protein [Kiritimatiellia bacterium]
MSNEETTAQGRKSIEAKLRRAWKQERRFYHLRGISRLMVWLFTMILLDLLIDWQILFRSRISGRELLILFAVNLGVLAWVLWHEWLRFLKPYHPEIVALEVEDKHPELASLLITYTQLKGPALEATGASPALLEAMRKQAVLKTKPLDFREVVNFRQLRNLLLVATGTLLLFSAVTFNWTSHMQSLLLRMLGAEVAYPTRTQIVSMSGDMTVKQGETIRIRAQATGKIPDEGRVYVRSEDETTWQILPLARTGSDEFFRQMPELYEDLVYRVRIGDARSETFTITVSPPPEIVAAKVQLTYPLYMRDNGAPAAGADLNLEVPMDTHIAWDLRCRPPVTALKVKMGEKTIDATIDASGTRATFEIVATNTFKYTFIWTEREHGFTYDDVLHVIRVVEDRIPDVELIHPSGDRLATTNKTVKILARATDDHGLAEATLVYSLNGQKEERVEMRPLKGVSEDIDHNWVPKKTLPDLKEGDVLSFFLEVSDRRPPEGSHINISAARRLSIVSEDQYLEWFRNELKAQREKIVRARKSEKKARDEVENLKAEEKK